MDKLKKSDVIRALNIYLSYFEDEDEKIDIAFEFAINIMLSICETTHKEKISGIIRSDFYDYQLTFERIEKNENDEI